MRDPRHPLAGEGVSSFGRRPARNERTMWQLEPAFPIDALAEIAARLRDDDVLSFSLVCRDFLQGARVKRWKAGLKLKTSMRALVGTPARAEWAMTSFKQFKPLDRPRTMYEIWTPTVETKLCTVAAKGGALSTVMFMHAKSQVSAYKPSVDWDEVCDGAASCGQLEVLAHLEDAGVMCITDRSCRAAARGGHVRILDWMLKRNKSKIVSASTVHAAAAGGQLDCLKWLRALGAPWARETAKMAAVGGHFELLRWARSKGCPWDEDTPAFCAQHGHLDMLQWAVTNGCPWDSDACYCAARGGQLEALQWLRAHGCPWDPDKCYRAADLEVDDRAKGCLISSWIMDQI